MKFEIFGKTDVGRKRQNNEDNLFVDEKIGLFLVADGMGGHNAGEVASKMAVDVTTDSIRKFLSDKQKAVFGKIDPNFGERANQIASAIRLSNQFIFETARANPHQQGMGTTIDCILIDKNKIVIGHIGDSRVYIVRAGQLEQITNDHSVVAEQVRKGLLSPEEAEKSPMKHILTRALGVDETVDVDLVEKECYDGDVVVACTDGLNKCVTDDEIKKSVLEMKTPKMIAEHLIDLANVGGGVDNVTVAVARFLK